MGAPAAVKDSPPRPTASSSPEAPESPVRGAGVDYVSLAGTVVLGVMGCFALSVGNEVVALAVGTGIVGFMARQRTEGK